jgi:hypothetical protein
MHIHCSTLNWDIRPTGVKQPCTWIVPTDSFPRFAILVVPQVRSYAMAMVRGVMGAPGPRSRILTGCACLFRPVLLCFMPSRSTQPDQACEIAGVPPQYEEIEFADEDELRAFVADRNERRDITSGGGGPRQAVPRSQEDRAGK